MPEAVANAAAAAASVETQEASLLDQIVEHAALAKPRSAARTW